MTMETDLFLKDELLLHDERELFKHSTALQSFENKKDFLWYDRLSKVCEEYDGSPQCFQTAGTASWTFRASPVEKSADVSKAFINFHPELYVARRRLK